MIIEQMMDIAWPDLFWGRTCKEDDDDDHSMGENFGPNKNSRRQMNPLLSGLLRAK